MTYSKNITVTPITFLISRWLIKNTLDLRELKGGWSRVVGNQVRSKLLELKLISRVIKNKGLLRGIWLGRNWMNPN